MARAIGRDAFPCLKADFERELGTWSLNCKSCGRDVHWVPGLGVQADHWAHAEPAPQEPAPSSLLLEPSV
jgi:hypothetical protein